MIRTLSFLSFVLVLCSGCASIISGPRQKISFKSNPPGAKVTVVDATGITVLQTNTPAVVKLSRSKGFFAGGEYHVRMEQPGFQPSETHLTANMNGWYVGNVVFGGLIGLVFVDPATGAMWSLSPNKLDVALKQEATKSAALTEPAKP